MLGGDFGGSVGVLGPDDGSIHFRGLGFGGRIPGGIKYELRAALLRETQKWKNVNVVLQLKYLLEQYEAIAEKQQMGKCQLENCKNAMSLILMLIIIMLSSRSYPVVVMSRHLHPALFAIRSIAHRYRHLSLGCS